MVAHFDKLAPWAMYFALEYFLAVEPRPPVGAAVAGAKEWWRDNPILPLLFQDYFARRAGLGDAAEFGPALDAPSASPPAVIRAFLDRVNHPLAAALIAAARRHRAQQHRPRFPDHASAASGRDQSAAELLVEPDDWRQPLARPRPRCSRRRSARCW